jgi:hypothetical protein
MIPMFNAKEEEAQHEFKRLSGIKQQLQEFKQEIGVKNQPRQA